MEMHVKKDAVNWCCYKQIYLGVDTLALLEVFVHPEQCGREHEAGLPVASRLLHHLDASGSPPTRCIVARAHQKDLHNSEK